MVRGRLGFDARLWFGAVEGFRAWGWLGLAGRLELIAPLVLWGSLILLEVWPTP